LILRSSGLWTCVVTSFLWMVAVDLSTTLSMAYKNIWYHKPDGQCQLERREAGTNYHDLVVQKGAQGLNTLHMFLSFWVVSLFVNCKKRQSSWFSVKDF
jgi:hypothetical protein